MHKYIAQIDYSSSLQHTVFLVWFQISLQTDSVCFQFICCLFQLYFKERTEIFTSHYEKFYQTHVPKPSKREVVSYFSFHLQLYIMWLHNNAQIATKPRKIIPKKAFSISSKKRQVIDILKKIQRQTLCLHINIKQLLTDSHFGPKGQGWRGRRRDEVV